MDSRKIGTIAAAVVCTVVAAVVIYWTIKSQQVQIIATVNGGTGTNPKVQYMKSHKAGQTPPAEEKDPNTLGDK